MIADWFGRSKKDDGGVGGTVRAAIGRDRDEKAAMDAGLAAMERQLGRPVRFRAKTEPGAFSVEISLEPPTKDRPRGYIGAVLTAGPMEGEDHERFADLPDGDYNMGTLERVFDGIRNVFAETGKEWQPGPSARLP